MLLPRESRSQHGSNAALRTCWYTWPATQQQDRLHSAGWNGMISAWVRARAAHLINEAQPQGLLRDDQPCVQQQLVRRPRADPVAHEVAPILGDLRQTS